MKLAVTRAYISARLVIGRRSVQNQTSDCPLATANSSSLVSGLFDPFPLRRVAFG
jgi:hypothetical protein